jgi:hypothetical protein
VVFRAFNCAEVTVTVAEENADDPPLALIVPVVVMVVGLQVAPVPQVIEVTVPDPPPAHVTLSV